MKSIPQRELRNNIARILRDVEAGEHLRVTVNGRPVADVIPIEGLRRKFVKRAAVEELLRTSSADPGLAADLESAVGQTIDEME